jgi:hypothetical protein
VAAHAEVHDQRLAVVERCDQVFAAAVDVQHPAALEPRGEVGGQRKAQVVAALLNAGNADARHHRLKAPADGLDLWQLRHVRTAQAPMSVTTPAPAVVR